MSSPRFHCQQRERNDEWQEHLYPQPYRDEGGQGGGFATGKIYAEGAIEKLKQRHQRPEVAPIAWVKLSQVSRIAGFVRQARRGDQIQDEKLADQAYVKEEMAR